LKTHNRQTHFIEHTTKDLIESTFVLLFIDKLMSNHKIFKIEEYID